MNFQKYIKTLWFWQRWQLVNCVGDKSGSWSTLSGSWSTYAIQITDENLVRRYQL